MEFFFTWTVASVAHDLYGKAFSGYGPNLWNSCTTAHVDTFSSKFLGRKSHALDHEPFLVAYVRRFLLFFLLLLSMDVCLPTHKSWNFESSLTSFQWKAGLECWIPWSRMLNSMVENDNICWLNFKGYV